MQSTLDETWKQGHGPAVAARARTDEDRYELITTPEALLALREQWEQLCARSRGHYLGQTFAWAWLCWQAIARPRGRGLACLVARRDGALVLVWPLAIAHDGWGGSVARPLDSESSEYGNVLVEDGPDAERRVASALAMWRRAGCFDRLELAYVRPDTVLGRALRRWGSGTQALRTDSLPAAAVAWKAGETWEHYVGGLHARQRHDLRRKKRRLGERGDLRLEVLGDAARCAPVIAWSLAQKLEWLARTGRRNEWITAPDHRTFLEASFAAFGASGRRLLFVLRLDEEILATMLSSADDVRLECFMSVSHPAYGPLSPAQVLLEQVLQWAHACWPPGSSESWRRGCRRTCGPRSGPGSGGLRAESHRPQAGTV